MIQVTFPPGVTALTVHGLTQWDYGQQLEITCSDLPAVVEIHFAAVGSKDDAVVRSVSAVNGVATGAIPNALLERTETVLAWVYVVGENSGTTVLTVTMPIMARARPIASAVPPDTVTNPYTEAVGAVNTAVDQLKSGEIIVALAQSAMYATSDRNGRNIAATYAQGSADYVGGDNLSLPSQGLYHVRVMYRPAKSLVNGWWVDFGLVWYDGINSTCSVSGHYSDIVRLSIGGNGSLLATGDTGGAGPSTYYYKPIWLTASAVTVNDTETEET